jgi:hypothetical protein
LQKELKLIFGWILKFIYYQISKIAGFLATLIILVP